MPDPKPTYNSDAPGRVKGREQADALMANIPTALQAWADRQGVSLTNRDSGVWGNVEKKLQRDGLWDVARIWRDESISDLIKTRVTGHRPTAKEIVMRCIREQMYKPRPSLTFQTAAEDSRDLDCLPRDLRWIYCHPLLVPGVDENDPVVRAVVASYERTSRAPHQGAINRFNHCRENPKARDLLFREIESIVFADRKGQLAPVDPTKAETAEKSKDEQEAAELFDELAFENALLEDGGED
jgi:hypothetical protein